jgi:hypothetical protein
VARSNLLSRTPHVLAEDEVKTWRKVRGRMGKDDFGCLLCGRMFQAGDTIRWIYANFKDSPFRYGNFHICSDCDSGDDRDCLERAASAIPTVNRVLAVRLKA